MNTYQIPSFVAFRNFLCQSHIFLCCLHSSLHVSNMSPIFNSDDILERQHPLMGGKSRRSRRSGTRLGGGRLPHVAGPPLTHPPSPHTWLPHQPSFPHSHKGVPPPPSPPPESLLLNLAGGKVTQQLHHHSGVPTGIQRRLVFRRTFKLVR